MALNSYGTGYEFEVNGVSYSANRLSAFDQINVARILGPSLIRILAKDENIFTKALSIRSGSVAAPEEPSEGAEEQTNTDAGAQTRKRDMSGIIEIATLVFDAFAELSEDVVHKVIAIVMRQVFRPSASGQGIASMWDPQANDLASNPRYPAPDGFTVLQIVASFLTEEFNNGLAQRFTTFAVNKPAPAART